MSKDDLKVNTVAENFGFVSGYRFSETERRFVSGYRFSDTASPSNQLPL
jgi:hypothetical protein